MENKRTGYYTHGTIAGTGQRFTVCALIVNDARVQIGVTYCSSEDQFSRKQGRHESLKKAIHNYVYRFPLGGVRFALNIMHEFRNRIEKNGRGSEHDYWTWLEYDKYLPSEMLDIQ